MIALQAEEHLDVIMLYRRLQIDSKTCYDLNGYKERTKKYGKNSKRFYKG